MIKFEWGFCEVRYMDFERILNVDKKIRSELVFLTQIQCSSQENFEKQSIPEAKKNFKSTVRLRNN